MRGIFNKVLALLLLLGANAHASPAFVDGAHDAFDDADTPAGLRAALLATAERESSMNVHYKSAPSQRDERVGGSFTAYQILKPHLLRLLKREGLQWSEVIPTTEVTDPVAVRRYARLQTRLALRLARESGYVWNTSAPEHSALNLFSMWAAGSWTWPRVRRTPAVRQVLGDEPLPADTTSLRELGRVLRLRKLDIAASAVFKLALYRRWQPLVAMQITHRM